MAKRNLNDLLYFVTVAREGSFTRAASLLGITQSALSQAISGLEARLGIRLLTRTTRSVSPTTAGERLLDTVGYRLDEIEAGLDELTGMRDKPAGTVRITCGEHVLRSILLPRLAPLLREYPDIKVEFDINYGFRDIVADRFDAGVHRDDAGGAVDLVDPLQRAPQLAQQRFGHAGDRADVVVDAAAGRAGVHRVGSAGNDSTMSARFPGS